VTIFFFFTTPPLVEFDMDVTKLPFCFAAALAKVDCINEEKALGAASEGIVGVMTFGTMVVLGRGISSLSFLLAAAIRSRWTVWISEIHITR
jgi:hypothetical protein